MVSTNEHELIVSQSYIVLKGDGRDFYVGRKFFQNLQNALDISDDLRAEDSCEIKHVDVTEDDVPP